MYAICIANLSNNYVISDTGVGLTKIVLSEALVVGSILNCGIEVLHENLSLVVEMVVPSSQTW